MRQALLQQQQVNPARQPAAYIAAEEEHPRNGGWNKRMVQSKPIISQVLRSLRVQPGMTFALVLDIEQKLWVVESCPAGTHFWTLDQAAELPKGPRTHRALHEIVTLGRETLQIKLAQHATAGRMRSCTPLRDRSSTLLKEVPHAVIEWRAFVL